MNCFLASDPKFKGSFLYKANGLVFCFTFFLFRIAFNFYNLYKMASLSWWVLAVEFGMWSTVSGGLLSLCIALSLAAVAHAAMNIVWFVLIVKSVRRKLVGGFDASKSVKMD